MTAGAGRAQSWGDLTAGCMWVRGRGKLDLTRAVVERKEYDEANDKEVTIITGCGTG